MNIEEPLSESALLAMDWSRKHCGACAHYHGAWQLLRHLDVLNSMRSDDDYFLPKLREALVGGARRILVSGSADYAMLARILAAGKSAGVAPEVTIIDRCRTPLELNRWLANRAGIEILVEEEDALTYTRPGAFDLVCTHSFLPFFSEEQRPDLVAAWWNNLAPGGAVLTAQRVRPGLSGMHGYSEERREALARRAGRQASKLGDAALVEPTDAERLARDYAAGHRTWMVSGTQYLQDLFETAGFVLEHFAGPDTSQPQPDLPTVPVRDGDVRWRILARKPTAAASA